MKAYYFRRKDSDKTMFIGLAVVSSLKELFWTIDEHDDPYGYEFAPAVSGDSIVVLAVDESRQAAADCGSDDWSPFEYLSVSGDEHLLITDPARVDASESMLTETTREWRTFGENFKCS